MAVHAFRFDSSRFHAARKGRHPLVRLALGAVGVALLAVLAMFSVVLGAAMIAGGVAYRLWRRRGTPIARGAQRVVEGEYRVVPAPVPQRRR